MKGALAEKKAVREKLDCTGMACAKITNEQRPDGKKAAGCNIPAGEGASFSFPDVGWGTRNRVRAPSCLGGKT